jgi:acyl-coenzyme A synthetase/AMP-(fatty) acid ligase
MAESKLTRAVRRKEDGSQLGYEPDIIVSGDLGRYEVGRGFLYAGWVDHDVKIRGFRVELGEIERVVRSACGANQVAVIPWPPSKDGNAIGCVAFVPKAANGSLEVAIRSACVQPLPDSEPLDLC